MNIPFIKWINTNEGTAAMLRLFFFIMFFPTAYFDPYYIYTGYFGSILGIVLFSKGFFIVIKLGLYFLTYPEFKTMLNGKNPNRFIKEGPYSYCRHPFYFGFSLMFSGMMLPFTSLLTLLCFVTYHIFTYIAITEEEKKLVRIFPSEYTAYQKEVPRFYPRSVWGLITVL